MAGTRPGGLRAAQTNKRRHGDSFYVIQGRKGGSRKVPKGFAMASKEELSAWGKLGGSISRRRKK